MKNKCIWILGALAAVCVTAGLLITAVEAAVYWTPGYFQREYEKHQVLEAVDMDMEDLLTVTDQMMSYLRGDREELQVVTFVDGRQQPFFNQREISHMEDVKGLFLGGMMLRRICFALAAVMILAVWRMGGLRRLPQGFLAGIGIVFVGGALAAGLVSADFNRYFTLFHHIFFDNDLWLLNPDTDRLINIVPLGFFMDTVLWIAVIFGVFMALLLGVSFFALARGKQRTEKKPASVRKPTV